MSCFDQHGIIIVLKHLHKCFGKMLKVRKEFELFRFVSKYELNSDYNQQKEGQSSDSAVY